jgi:hypothetical protein
LQRVSIQRTTAGKRLLFLALVLVVSLSHAACAAGNGVVGGTPPEQPKEVSKERVDGMKIRIKVGDKTVTATLIDSETARDFISLLPLTLTMNDLFGREKFSHLPRAISTEGERAHTYEVGDIAYWSPGPDVAVFYRHDGQEIPKPGIIVIGKIDSGVEALNVPGSVKVTVELIKEGPR